MSKGGFPAKPTCSKGHIIAEVGRTKSGNCKACSKEYNIEYRLLLSKGMKIVKKERAWNFKDLTGQVFNRLTVIKFDKLWHKKVYWLCKCVCGKIKSIRQDGLTGNQIKSCGCLHIELVSIRIAQIGRETCTTHGMTKTSFYRVWRAMQNRCYNKNVKEYSNYGGRDITVCERWLESFENFRDDMYESYLKHVEIYGIGRNTSLDRYPNPDGNYEPSNCKWSTSKEQCETRRTTTKTENPHDHAYWRQKLGNALRDIIRFRLKRSFIDKYLGCSSLEFRKYIESQFTEGMTWENHGVGIGKWQFDHMLGCNNFDLSIETNRYKCYHFSNIHPMWWEDHKKKSICRRKV